LSFAKVVHIASIAGAERVGFGADYDGVDALPIGFDDVSKYPNLVAELLKSGFSDDQIVGMLQRNLLRVWSTVEKVAYNLRRDPLEMTLDDTKYCPAQWTSDF
jgi:membrane dipeptidase